MLLDRLAVYLDGESDGFSYVMDDPRMEIRIGGKEWFPIIINEIDMELYIISWGELEYQFKNEEKAYQYVLRLCQYIKESLQNK